MAVAVEAWTCFICDEQFDKKSHKAVFFPCFHTFGLRCIKVWFNFTFLEFHIFISHVIYHAFRDWSQPKALKFVAHHVTSPSNYLRIGLRASLVMHILTIKWIYMMKRLRRVKSKKQLHNFFSLSSLK
jgi:hypothetical protein